RLVAIAPDRATIAGLLAEFLGEKPSRRIITGTAVRDGKLAFVFSGNGAQFAGMGRDAFRTNQSFRNAIEELDGLLRPELDWSVAEFLDGEGDAAAMARADIAQPLLFAVQVGIVRALRELGIVASGYLGHSVGEIAAAWAAGALSLREAGRVVLARSRCQQRTQGRGRMAAVALAPTAARDFLAELDSEAEVAAHNATHSVTISGPGAEIERLEAEAKRRSLWFRPLDLDFAFHSKTMDPIRRDLLESLAGLSSQRPQARLVSTVTGEAVEDHLLDANYWWRNIRSPVRFSEAATLLVNEGHRIFVEIGPLPILQSYLNDALRAVKTEGRVLATLSRKPVDQDPFPAIAAHCYVAGFDLAKSPCFSAEADPRGLPLYPWDRQRCWFGISAEASDPVNPPFDHPLLGFRQRGPIRGWLNHLDAHVLPWIADHAIEGMPVLPAAAVVEMALAAAKHQWPDAPALEVCDLEVRRPMPFDRGRMREVRTLIGSEDSDWELASRPRLSSEPLTTHAVGRLRSGTDKRRIFRWTEGTPIEHRIDRNTLYTLARRAGLQYGDLFRTVGRVEITGANTAAADLDPSPVDHEVGTYLLHPALLDGALQVLLGLLAERQHHMQGVCFLPWRFGRVRLLAPFGRLPRRVRLSLTRLGVRSISADIGIYDEAGEPVAELSDCWLRRVELSRRGTPDERSLRVDLVPAPLTELAPPPVLDECGGLLSGMAAACAPEPARQEQSLLLDAMIGSIAFKAMQRIVEPERAFSIAELVETRVVASDCGGLLECLLRTLERFGAATRIGSQWRLQGSSDLPEAEEIWRLLLADAPDLVAELALVAPAIEGLPKTLAEGQRRPDGSFSAMLEQLLVASPANTFGVGIICDALHQIAAQWPKERPLRILEIGALGGGVTRRVLDRLCRAAIPFAYLATSPDPEHTARLSLLAGSFSGMSARHWSPDEGHETLADGPFDIILAINACARLKLDADGLAKLRQLLVPGGVIIAVEPEPNTVWEMTFGQDPEWWLQTPHGRQASPLRSAAEWRTELAAAGFQSADATPSFGAPWPCALFWGTAPGREASARPEAKALQSILLVGGHTGFAAAVCDGLREAGHRVTLTHDADRNAEWFLSPENGANTILFLAEQSFRRDPIESVSQQLSTLAQLATAVAGGNVELWVVSCDAQQPAPTNGASAFVGNALWGLARVLVNETPRLRVRRIDLASSLPRDERVRQIAAEMGAASGEDDIVWTPEGRHVLRMRAGLPAHWADEATVLKLASRHPGGLDALGWDADTLRPVGPGEVEIAVHAAGLNFRDMMWAMGLLPEQALIDGFAGPTFGLECAGVIRSIGVGVA
ncbi:MAG TPA: acyltransferase domain-containing protein, partial [Stellaceae bacterium]|nr:acyltransferase domain-containing protein [Stellaceae bacterium]